MAITPNRGYVYPDENVDDWYTTFQAMMTSIDLDIQALLVSNPINDVTIKKSTPALRFQGQEASAVEFRIVESAGVLYIQKNTGSASVPVWVSLTGWDTNGNIIYFVAGKGPVLYSPNGSLQREIRLENDETTSLFPYP